MIRMNLSSPKRLCGVGMLWIRGLILGSFATAFMPLRPFMLEPHFHAFAEGLLWPPPLASPYGFAAQLKQETPIAPFTIGQERQIACVLDDITQQMHGLLKELAILASTAHLPQKTAGPVHQHQSPSLRLVRSDVLLDSRIQLIPFNELL